MLRQNLIENINNNYAGRFADQGHELLRLKKFNEAIALFDKLIAINPNNTKALNEKGDALLELEKLQ